MKKSIYTYKSNGLVATISKGLCTKFDWYLELKSKCGGKLIINNNQNIFLTKREAVNHFEFLKTQPYIIKETN